MTGDSLPPYFWAKLSRSPDSRSSGSYLSLPAHSLDVSVVFRRLANLPAFRRQLETSACHVFSDNDMDRLAVVSMLHDLGKPNRGFQAKQNPKARDTAGHVLEAAVFLFDETIQPRWPAPWIDLIQDMATWFDPPEEALCQILLAAVSHHGKPVSENDIRNAGNLQRWWQPSNGIDPMEGIAQLAETAHREYPSAFSPAERPIRATPAFQQRFAGILMLADWIGSDTRFFPLGIESDRRALAEQGASRALKTIGLIPEALLSLPPFEKCFTPGFPPNALQKAVDELPIGLETRLVLVESDTGSGKTEAALRWFWRLYAENRVEGLYFALPTRVAARELYGRVLKTVDSVFPNPDCRPSPVLLAVPGYVQADGEPTALQNPENLLWEDDRHVTLSEKLWAAERPKRFLAAPVAVGTIDQAMLSVLKVNHSLLRSVCLDRHLLVVDEVHASDTYMSDILNVLLKAHVTRGGFAMLLSATLGESARARYFDRMTMPLHEATERTYPSITILGNELPVASESTGKTVRIHWLRSLDNEPVLYHLNNALTVGARVLVVCNTVDRAQTLLRTVESAGFDSAWLFRFSEKFACPHHGRFARSDRAVLDRAVSLRFGKGSPQGPVLLIGTQTLEQSLDIDADYLITDLAPIDVLLQRIGRLHRHSRTRPPGFENATISIRIPEKPLPEYLRPDGSLKGPAGIGSVYDNGCMLQRTIDVLSEMRELVIPKQNRYLVEECTHDEALEKLPKEIWQRHRDWLWGPRLADLRQAEAAVLPDEPFGVLHYPDDGRKILTRLGEGDISVQFSTPMQSPFGKTIQEILLPYWWLPAGFLKTDPVSPEPLSDGAGFTFEVAGRFFRYTRFGLERRHDESVD